MQNQNYVYGSIRLKPDHRMNHRPIGSMNINKNGSFGSRFSFPWGTNSFFVCVFVYVCWVDAYRLIIPGVFNALCRRSITTLFSHSAILIHGCCSTASALNRFGAFFTRRPLIKSFASLLTSAHSLSGKLNRPVTEHKSNKQTHTLLIELIGSIQLRIW